MPANSPIPPIRLNRWLKDHFPQMTSRHIDEAIGGSLVSIKDLKSLTKHTRVEVQHQVNTDALQTHLMTLRLGNPSLRLATLFAGPDFVCIDKPAGMPGHPLGLWETDTVTHWCLAQFPQSREEFPAVQPTVTPHRLDIGTSGALIVCQTAASYLRWRGYFSDKKIQKSYLAWCWGHPKEKNFSISRGIEHSWDSRRMQIAKGGGQEAQSDIEILTTEKGYFLCEVTCRTGVTHQVRVHLAALGYPLVGDALYDQKSESRPLKVSGHQLRAVKLVTPEGEITAPRQVFESGPALGAS